jgi:hypothetical protein
MPKNRIAVVVLMPGNYTVIWAADIHFSFYCRLPTADRRPPTDFANL